MGRGEDEVGKVKWGQIMGRWSGEKYRRTYDDEQRDGRGNESDDLSEVGDVVLEGDRLSRGAVEQDCTSI